MAGRLNRWPYPSDAMVDVLHVTTVGKTMALTKGDNSIQTEDPPGSGHWRPSAPGDVISRPPGGPWQGRIAGTAGAFEVFEVNGLIRVFNPTYEGGPVNPPVEGFLYWDVPNE